MFNTNRYAAFFFLQTAAKIPKYKEGPTTSVRQVHSLWKKTAQ